MTYPVIPETVTVHLGAPDAAAPNVTVSFPDYIKNVASSEIYPTWPENSLRANILAQISFALNRIYTEYYRSRGYDFDITNSTASDQAFVPERDIYENISRIVDDIFNDYITREGFIEPLYAIYCNGTTTTCEGLSQWGSVTLAEEGLLPYEILQNYYGNDIQIIENASIADIEPSEPEILLRLGTSGNDVAFIQTRLNRISVNYPSIPKISPVDGVFGIETEDAVREFQRVFDLTQDGIVGRATWYKIQFLYNAVKRLNELISEGLTDQDLSLQYPEEITVGDTGFGVETIQYYINLIAEFNPEIPSVTRDGVYDEETQNAVATFQRIYGLPVTGNINDGTWNLMYDVYLGIIESLDEEKFGEGVPIFPGVFLKLGSTGEDVSTLQTFINGAAQVYPQIPIVAVDGVFGTETRDAVYTAQALFGYPVNGIVGPLLWETLGSITQDVNLGAYRAEGQFPGGVLSEENT